MNQWKSAPLLSGLFIGGKRAITLVIPLLACARCWAASDLVITSEDFPLDVGRRVTWTFRSADGTMTGKTDSALVGAIELSDATLFREVCTINAQQRTLQYWEKGPKGVVIYPSFGRLPLVLKIPFPLREGTNYQLDLGGETVKATVEGPEHVTTPLGRFRCLVLVLDRKLSGLSWKQRVWVAPGVGMVKLTWPMDQEYTFSLASLEGPAPRPPEPGAFVLSNFDFGDPLVSPLFPNARWQGAGGKTNVSSICDVEPSDSALGTPFCMRWAYHTMGTWVSAQLPLSVPQGEPADLSSYDSMSFYVKGLAERSCSFQLQTAPWTQEGLTRADIPIKVTPEWQKIVIPLKTHPGLKGIDLAKTYMIGFSDWDESFAANVIWIDEVMLHRANSPMSSAEGKSLSEGNRSTVEKPSKVKLGPELPASEAGEARGKAEKPIQGATGRDSLTVPFGYRVSPADNIVRAELWTTLSGNFALTASTTCLEEGYNTFVVPGFTNGKYEWNVCVFFDDGSSHWLDSTQGDRGNWRFTVMIDRMANQSPNPPLLASPSHESRVSQRPTFQLSATDPENDRIKLRIELLRDGVIVDVFDQRGSAAGWNRADYGSGEMAAFTLPEDRALATGTYQWRAYAFDAGRASDVSATRSFLVSQQKQTQILGKVTDLDGKGIKNCQILALAVNEVPLLADQGVFTDDDGRFAITVPKGADYDLRVNPPATEVRPAHTEVVRIKEGETRELTIKLWDEPSERIKKYAPALYFFHPAGHIYLYLIDEEFRPEEEKYRPMPAELFLDHSTISVNGKRVKARRRVAENSAEQGPMDLEGNRPQEYELLFKQYGRAYYGYNPSEPIVYARIYNDEHSYVIQYWLHYLHNPHWPWPDHEGDWEMVQLTWDSPNPPEDEEPDYATYSRHLSHETRTWDQVDKEESTHHPRLYVAYGSHASYFDNGFNGLQLGDLVGTWGPFFTIPVLFPHSQNCVGRTGLVECWSDFAGRWGAQLLSPVGPAQKGLQWSEPVSWARKEFSALISEVRKELKNQGFQIVEAHASPMMKAPNYESPVVLVAHLNQPAELSVVVTWLDPDKPITVNVEVYHKANLLEPWGQPQKQVQGKTPPLHVLIGEEIARRGYWGYKITARHVPSELHPCAAGAGLAGPY